MDIENRKCPRGRKDCAPSLCFESDTTLCCAGLHDGTTNEFPQDVVRHCWITEAEDSMVDVDFRDIAHTITVLNAAVSDWYERNDYENHLNPPTEDKD